MNDESRRILRCHACDEACMTAPHVSDEALAKGWTIETHVACAHESACKRAYRIGASDTRRSMQDDGR